MWSTASVVKKKKKNNKKKTKKKTIDLFAALQRKCLLIATQASFGFYKNGPGRKMENKKSAYNIPFPCGLTGDVIMWVLVVRYRCVLRLLHPPLLLTLLSCLLERNTNTGRFLLFYKFLKIIRTECHLAGSTKEASLEWLRVYTRRCSGYLHAQTSLLRGRIRPFLIMRRHLKPVVCVFVTGHRAAEQTG